MKITGTLINYYTHCKKECWNFANQILCDQRDDSVKIGKYYHEERNKNDNNKQEFSLPGIKIDEIGEDYVIEYKKSSSDTKAAKLQLLYYLFRLEQKGIKKDGLLKFHDNRDDIEVKLTKENRKLLQDIMASIERLIEQDKPPKVKRTRKCRKCAYFEYCWI